MKTLTLFLLFTFSLASVIIAQTRNETESFIRKYIEGNPQNNGAENERNDVVFTTTSDGDYLMIYSNYLPYIGQSIFTFAPSNIQSIAIDKTSMKGQNIIIKIRLKYGKKALMVFNQSIKEYKDSFDIILGNSAFANDIPERLKKAIEHLSRLAGGDVTEDKF